MPAVNERHGLPRGLHPGRPVARDVVAVDLEGAMALRDGEAVSVAQDPEDLRLACDGVIDRGAVIQRLHECVVAAAVQQSDAGAQDQRQQARRVARRIGNDALARGHHRELVARDNRDAARDVDDRADPVAEIGGGGEGVDRACHVPGDGAALEAQRIHHGGEVGAEPFRSAARAAIGI